MFNLKIGITHSDDWGKALIIDKFEESEEKDMMSDICTPTFYEASGEEGIDQALHDWEEGLTDAILIVPEEGKWRLNPASLRGTDMLVWGDVRLAFATDECGMEEQIDEITYALRREFEIDKPRIAAAFDTDNLHAYDVVLTKDKDEAIQTFLEITHGHGIAYTTGRELIATSPLTPESINQCIYLSKDILAARSRYDAARSNPLPKLFHDRKEDPRRS